MSIQEGIEAKLAEALQPAHLQVINESNNHNVPPGSESHFKLVIVADDFVGVRDVQRHQRVYKILATELAGDVHALAIHVYTLSEWRDRHGDAPMSPPCLGGSKSE